MSAEIIAFPRQYKSRKNIAAEDVVQGLVEHLLQVMRDPRNAFEREVAERLRADGFGAKSLKD